MNICIYTHICMCIHTYRDIDMDIRIDDIDTDIEFKSSHFESRLGYRTRYWPAGSILINTV